MSEISTEVPTTPGERLPDWERDLIALDAQRQEQFNAWIDKQGYVDPLGQLAEAFEGGWGGAAAHVASSGYQGPASHTYTTECDGFHPIGEQCNLPAAPGDASKPLARYALVEQMGFRRTYGTVRETEFAGKPMAELTPLDGSSVRLVAPESLYQLTWLTKDQAERATSIGAHAPAAIGAAVLDDPWGERTDDDDYRQAGIDATPELYDHGGKERDYDAEGNEL